MRYETEKRIVEIQNIERVLEYGKGLERINPIEFEDIYSPEEVIRDLEHLNLAEKKIDESREKMGAEEMERFKTNEKRGRAFEILLMDQIYNGEWLGPEAMSVRTSRFDDVLNGVDMVVEFNQEDTIKRMALAVDASTTSDIDHMEKKIKRNIKRVAEDFWPLEVKYFQSQIIKDGECFRGKLENLIPVVIGADRQNADRVFDIFAELICLEKKADSNYKERSRWLKEKLSLHPIQDIFFDQIEIQLKMYISILKRKDRPTDDLEVLLAIIKEEAEKKRSAGFSTSEEINGDMTLDNIRIIGQKYSHD